MSFDDVITRGLSDHLDRMPAPPVDLIGVRRAGRRRRRQRSGGVALAVAAVLIAGGVGFDRLLTELGTGRDVEPNLVAGLDFRSGLRAYYDDVQREVHMGGTTFDIGAVQYLDTSASATPSGLIFIDDNQAVRLLREDGAVELLAAAPEDPVTFNPSVKFDAASSLAAWVTQGSAGLLLTVHDLATGEQRTTEVPASCAGSCAEGRVAMAGLDNGRVLVRDGLPSGECTPIGTLPRGSTDPIFIGNDM